jgi:transposase-like protein
MLAPEGVNQAAHEALTSAPCPQLCAEDMYQFRGSWVYPVVFVDAIDVKIRDGQVANRSMSSWP